MKPLKNISLLGLFVAFTLAAGTLFVSCDGGLIAPGRDRDKDKDGPSGTSGFGLVEVTISGIGTAQMSAAVRPAQSNVAYDLTGIGSDGTIQFEVMSTGSFTVGERPNSPDVIKGYRYIYATLKVRNADMNGNPYQSPRTNLTFLAVDTDASWGDNETFGKTAISTLRLFNGHELSGQTAEKIAKNMLPTGAVTLNFNGEVVSRFPDVLQVFTENEVSNINPAAGVSIFPYGFITRSPKVTPGSRTMPDLTADGRTGDDQFDGVITFAFKLPLQTQTNKDPFEISMMFLPVDDSDTRVTQSPQERSAEAKNAFAARATELGATLVSLFPASTYSGAITSRTFCTTRVAGTESNPTALIGTDCSLDTWSGAVSTDWSDTGNWDTFPTFASPALIPSGAANAPIIGAGVDATVSTLTIEGTPLTITGGGTLTISELEI